MQLNHLNCASGKRRKRLIGCRDFILHL